MDETGNGQLIEVGGLVLTIDSAEKLLHIIEKRYKNALGGALAELATGVAYTTKAPAR